MPPPTTPERCDGWPEHWAPICDVIYPGLCNNADAPPEDQPCLWTFGVGEDQWCIEVDTRTGIAYTFCATGAAGE